VGKRGNGGEQKREKPQVGGRTEKERVDLLRKIKLGKEIEGVYSSGGKRMGAGCKNEESRVERGGEKDYDTVSRERKASGSEREWEVKKLTRKKENERGNGGRSKFRCECKVDNPYLRVTKPVQGGLRL